MKTVFSIMILFIATISQSQTKLISHKSHSGSRSTFSKAYKNGLFDISGSNYGLPGNRNIIVIDTIIAVNKSMTVVKWRESNVCYQYGTSYKALGKKDFITKVDTLVNDNVLNKKNALSYIKSSSYLFPIRLQNPVETVVFIGFRQ